MKEQVSKFNEKAKKRGANRTHPGFPWIFNGNVGPECPSYILQEGLEVGKRILLGLDGISWLRITNQLQPGLKLKACFLGSGWSLS